MEFEALDWETLDRLRAGFLSEEKSAQAYWQSRHDLAQYDQTFGERIGWKWDAVLAELGNRRWTPLAAEREKLSVLDWGCGSGIAGRRVINAVGAARIGRLVLVDHSDHARAFAAEQAQKKFPDLRVEPANDVQAVDVLVVSHVLNELTPAARAALLAQARAARSVLWVEPGTSAASRDLIGFREELRAEYQIIAPCTHQLSCGLLTPANAPHWCHNFAEPPASIYADSDWVRFGQRAGIDLRSLPYSFLVLEKSAAAKSATEISRVVGVPRHFKGYAKVLSCDAAGVVELTVQKRTDPALFKELKRGEHALLYHWERCGDQIISAQALTEAQRPDFGT